MSAVVEAHRLVSEIAGPMPAGAQIQEMLAYVARKTGLGSRRIRGIWNNEARAIRAEELDALRSAARSRQEEREAESRVEISAIIERLRLVEDRLAQIDPDLARHEGLARVRDARRVGRVARPLARPRPRQ